MNYIYQARDRSGEIVEGELIAVTAEQASQQLRHEGLFPLSIQEHGQEETTARKGLLKKRVPRSDVIYLTNQLAVMVDAGVPLASALEGLARQAENPTLKHALTHIHLAVEGGETLSAALADFPKIFDRTYVNLVKASEASGTLAEMLERIAQQTGSEMETRQKVKGAMMYPAVMLLMCIGVSIFLLTYVFPKLKPMFEVKAVEIPKPTQFMLFLSETMTAYWYLYLIGAVVIVGSIVYSLRQQWGRMAKDWCGLNLPIVGPMLRKVAISRSIRTLALTLKAGVPMLDALKLSAGVANNYFYEECWLKVGDQVEAGQQIHEALEGNPLIPATLLQMISSGESTGQLGSVLDRVSDYYDREVANAVKAATSLIEPVMVFVMGGVIGTIALAMLLPIFKLSSGH